MGFGYPWAVIAPILVGLGVTEIDAIRVAAIGNNAPVSYGALGAPIIALATVTNVPLRQAAAEITANHPGASPDDVLLWAEARALPAA